MRAAVASAILLGFTSAVTVLPSARAGESLGDALAASQWGLDFRYRIELVDEDGFAEDAEASTLRTRLNLKTGSYRGLQAFVEFADVREIVLDDFYAGFAGEHGRYGWNFVWHRFRTETGSATLGDEFNALLSVALHRTSSLLLKIAHVDDDDARLTGVTKFWLMLSVALP